jgi:LacI family transcriptional regulator
VRFVRQQGESTPRAHTREAIKRMILARGYHVGAKLPTYRQMADHFGVALFTVERVMKELAGEGIIQLLHGKGAFIRQLPAPDGQLGQLGLVYTGSRRRLIRTAYLNEILGGVVYECDQRQVDLQILSFWRAGQHVPVSPHDTVVRVDGSILLGITNDDYISRFAAEEVPLVLLDGQTSISGVHSVAVDNAGAAGLVMEHLYSLGHRRIAYLDAMTSDVLACPQPWTDSFDNRERRQGYLDAMERLHLGEHICVYGFGGVHMDSFVHQAVERFLCEPRRPSAVLAYDGDVAAHLCLALVQAGVRVPQEVSVAGVVGAQAPAACGEHVLTCAWSSFEEMGRLAVQSLADQAAGRAPASQVRRVPANLNVGTTTMAAPGA